MKKLMAIAKILWVHGRYLAGYAWGTVLAYLYITGKLEWETIVRTAIIFLVFGVLDPKVIAFVKDFLPKYTNKKDDDAI